MPKLPGKPKIRKGQKIKVINAGGRVVYKGKHRRSGQDRRSDEGKRTILVRPRKKPKPAREQIEAGLRKIEEHVRDRSSADSSYEGLSGPEDARLRQIHRTILSKSGATKQTLQQMLRDVRRIIQRYDIR